MEKDNIRSHKVRRIIKEKPVFIIRYGTLLLTIVLVFLGLICYCFIF